MQHHERCSGQTSYRATKIEHSVLEQLKKYVEVNPRIQKLYTQFQQAEPPIRKMIASQWIECVMVFSYEHIEVRFQENT